MKQPTFRKMTLKEYIFGREPDTEDVVVYKNMTLGEWFFGKSKDELFISVIQRITAIVCMFLIISIIWVIIGTLK